MVKHVNAGEAFIRLPYHGFPTPALSGSGSMGMISALDRAPRYISIIGMTREDLEKLHLPSPVLSGSGSMGIISASLAPQI